MVYRLCFIYLKNTAEAEDATQNIFIKLLTKKKVFTDYEHEKAWFIVVTKNYCKDVRKKWWNFNWVNIDTVNEFKNSYIEEKDNEVFEKLLSLPPKYKETLYLYYYEGYSVKDLSKLFNRKESTIQTHLFNGRKQLKLCLGGEYSG
jgi:RNA polymerase sigma-70 factor (ECF subfamily)